MGQKAYTLFYCALLASTLIHETRVKAQSGPSVVSQLLAKTNPPQDVCELKCDFNETSPIVGIQLKVFVSAGLLVIANDKANAVLVIDVKANLCALLDGNTGEALIINLLTKVGTYCSGGAWTANISLQVFISGLTGGLADLLKIGGAISFQVSLASTIVLKFCNRVLAFLVLNIGVELQSNLKLGIQIIISYATTKIGLLNGALKGLLEIIGTTVLTITVDLLQFLNICQGISLIFVQLGVTISFLLANGITIVQLLEFLTIGTGLELFIKIILVLGAKLNIGVALGSILNDHERCFNLIALLGGKGLIGLNGLITVIANLIGFINGHIKLEVFIITCIQYLAFNGPYPGQKLEVALIATLNILLEALEQVGLTEVLSGLVVIINALINGTLVINGVNISVCIKLLGNGITIGVQYLLTVLVAVLLELRAIVDITVSIPLCVFVLILCANTAIGIQILKLLGVVIDIDVIVIGSGGIIAYLLRLVTNLVTLLLGDIYLALTLIPGLGKIILALNSACQGASNGQVVLQVLLNNSNIFKNYVKGLCQLTTGINLGVGVKVTAEVKVIIDTCTKALIYQ